MTHPRLKWPLERELTDPDTQAASLRIRARVQERLFDRRALVRRPTVSVAAFVTCACLFFAGYWALSADPPGSAPEASGALLLKDGAGFHSLDATSSEAARGVTFSDGSKIEVAPGGQLRSLGSNDRKMMSLLERGKATFEVVPGGPRQWTVEAGGLSVEVIGTRFSVERTAQRVTVEVERGSVLVRSSHIADGVRRLDAGGALTVQQPPSINSASDAIEPAPADPPPSVTLDELQPELEANPSTPQAAESFPPRPPNTPSADVLMRRADEARRVGNTGEAIEALQIFLTKHPADPRTPAARFQLSRLYLSAGRFEEARASLALSARSQGPLSEDAYLRWIELERGQGETNTAKELASEYLRRYPQGRHRTLMESH